MLVGGGTGGHILPLLAVAHKLKNSQSNIKIIAVIDKSTRFASSLEESVDIDEVVRISAGKFRRYPNRGIIEALLDFKTIALNIRDGFLTLVGIGQSINLLRRNKPNIIFIKGSFVGVPIGLSAKLINIPFITHDSDASPGMANKIIGRWAKVNTVGMDKSAYSYPIDKIVQVGIPTISEFEKVTSKLKKQYRKEIKIPINAKLIFITGGSQGAQSLNRIITPVVNQLIANNNVYVIHQTGDDTQTDLPKISQQYRTVNYLPDLYRYSGASDVIITRAGSSIAEFAVQEKAVIAIPAPQLAGGHQLKNADILQNKKAVIVLNESELNSNPNILFVELINLLNSVSKQQKLAEQLSKIYPENATDKIAKLLLNC